MKKTNDKGMLIVISGPSGTGKGTICNQYLASHPETVMSVSYTTRKPRPGEVNGKSYNFTDKMKFKDMINQGSFFEYANVYGNYYGTPKKDIMKRLENGEDVILEIDVQGALKVKEQYPQGIFIFLAPPSLEELRRRIKKRGTETPESLDKRMGNAGKELSLMKKYDYVVVNDKKEETLQIVEAIIISEACKVKRNNRLIESYMGG